MSRSASKSNEKPYHHGNLLENLRSAGFDLLQESPGAAISMRELARRAGVSHQAPYHHFSDKKALLEDLSAECMRRFAVAQERSVSDANSGIAALHAQGTAYVRFAHAHPHAFALIYDPAVCDPGNPGAAKQEQIDRLEHLLAETARRAQAEGMFPESSLPDFTTLLWGLVHGLAQLVTAGHLTLEQAEASIAALGPSDKLD